MKKFLAIFILACIFLSPALTSSAAAHDYDYVYTDVNIITPDSFEDIFSETEADRASFTYEMATLNSSRAVVAMEIELKVGSDYYTTIVSGDIPAYTLPSGDILYEGPISGTITVHEDEYRVTAGFAKLESMGGVLVSVTLQGNSTMVAFSFGENLIQGEVLDFFMERVENGQQDSANNSSTIGNLDSGEFGNNPGDTASPMVIGDGFAPIFNPGDGGGSYPNFGNAVFQSRRVVTHDNPQYTALKSNVYWDSSSNELIVTVVPYTAETQGYTNTTVFDPDYVRLYSFGASLALNTQDSSDTTTKALILTTSNPSEETSDEYDKPLENYDYLTAIFLDILSSRDMFPNLIEHLFNSLYGRIKKDPQNDAYFDKTIIELSILSPGNATELDNTEVLAFGYFLRQHTPSQYVGNTRYEAKAYITYEYYYEISNPNGPNTPFWYYFSKETSHTGTINVAAL